MKIRILLILLTDGVILTAQQTTAGSADISIRPIVHEVKYCLGPTSYFPSKHHQGPSDITLRLSLKLLYENHRTGAIILPLRFGSIVRILVVGQQKAETIVSREDPFDAEALVNLAGPAPPYFIVIPGGKSDMAYLGELVDVPVLSSERRLLGKTVEFSITRNHGLFPLSIIQEFQVKWQAYGTLWIGTQETSTIRVSIPESPVTVDCRKDEKF